MPEFSEEVLELNDEAAETLIPAIVLICILMIIGLCGNPLVVYFYGCHLKPTASYMFIVTLAVFDLIICSVSMPLELVDIVRFYTFESPEACKLLRFVNYFASISSGGILIAIAVDRYRKICKPFESQISIKIARIVIIVVCVTSVLISWPSLVFYTVVEVNVTEVEGVIGFDCTTRRDSDYKVYITIYNIILFLCFITAITALLVLYILVGRQLCSLRSFKFYAKKKVDKVKRPGSSQTQCTDDTGGFGSFSESISKKSEIPIAFADIHDGQLTPIEEGSRPSSALSLALSTNRISPFQFDREDSDLTNGTSNKVLRISTSLQNALKPEMVEMPNRPNSARPSRGGFHATNSFGKGAQKFGHSTGHRGSSATSRISYMSSVSGKTNGGSSSLADVETRDAQGNANIDQRKLHSQNINTRKYTVVMLCITIAFIISFLPYLGLITWRTLSKDYEPNLLSKSELVAFQIFLRSFLINSAVNPLIYGFLNSEFQNFIVSLFRKVCFCCGKKAKDIHPSSKSENSVVSKSSSSR